MAQTVHARPADAGAASHALDVGAAYDVHAEFVWRALHRMGVGSEDLADLLQEVFVVVHRRRADYDPERPIRGCSGASRWGWPGITAGELIARSSGWRARRRRPSSTTRSERSVGSDGGSVANECWRSSIRRNAPSS